MLGPLAAFAQPLQAQAEADGTQAQSGFGAIVVTARRREETLQETPISITTFDADALVDRGISNLSGIGDFTPNLVFDQGTGNTGGSTSSQIYIRGIGQADFLFTTEPGVGIYVDGVYLPRSIGSIMDLVDLERVEVLRGPQGTLFGKNSVGGAVNIVTRRPQPEFGGRVSATYGSFDRVDIGGSVNLPLVTDTLLASVAFSSRDRDGYVRRVNDGTRLGGINSTGLRGQLLWKPSPNFDILVAADYTRKREDSIANTLIDVDQSGSLIGLYNGLVAPALGTIYDDRFISSDPFVSFGTGFNQSDLDLWGISSTATLELGAVTIKSITAYREQDAVFGADSDHSPIRYFEQSVLDEQEQFSQELQISGTAIDDRLDWIVGAMYFHESGFDQYRVVFAPGLFDALEALPPGIIPGLGGAGNPIHPALDFDGLLTSRINNDSYSAYGHFSFDITDRLSVSGGLRYTSDEKDFDSRFDRLSAGVTTHDVETGDSWNAWTPRIGVEYDWSDDLMTYASVARGFKSGGFNGRPTTEFVARTPFAPEFVWTYELGFNSMFADRRVILNGAAFYSDYSNLQLLSITSDPQGGIVALVENAGKARIMGFELELTAMPVPGLRFDAGLGYLDAEYRQLDASVNTITLSDDLVKTPEWSLSLGAEYTADLSDDWQLTIRGDYAYRSTVQHVADNNPLLEQSGYGVFNARLAFGPSDESWELAVFGTNIGDELYITNGLSQADTLGTTDVSYGRPREWGVSVSARF
ncbi:TonB-dependent receptor [Parasphingopyxis algicola]|uniref:TonB-dependent receptor n=1 Tax=Parasphingopyxis algicola TaxID=2026624 RepID=UPI00159FECE3|nr:TonB-dependent receptor [Parasphingopyxis algicola]QLC26445.1 TonB-dependent receptor [Parasphingopyxis algicola]